MKHLIPALDMVLSKLKPIPQDKREEGLEIVTEDSVYDLFDFMEEVGCFPENQIKQIRTYLSIELYDYEENENYAELNQDKFLKLLTALGINC